MTIRIALISPKGPLYRHKGGIFKKSLRYQPLTLTTLAAYIPDDIDTTLELYDEGIEEIPESLDVDLVGLTVITGTSKRAYEMADRYRTEGKTVILGGPHVTLVPEEAGKHADAICVGYAETTWPQLLRDFCDGELKSIYKQSEDFSLGVTAFPRRELLDRRKFLTQAVFEATRSCMHDCEFCVAPSAWGRRQYQRPVDWVVEDIRQVGDRRILFIDLNLIADKKYAKTLFTALIPLNVQWFGLSTVLLAHDDELKELMARSGCKGLLLGLETVNDTSLGDAGKRFNESVDFKTVIVDLHNLGISVQGCFVFGLDHDTPDVFNRTVEFAIDSGIDLPRFSILTPFPGTPLNRALKAQGRILSNNMELYDGQHVVFQPLLMSVNELANGHEKAWKEVYSWSAIARRLWNAKNFQPLALSANVGYRFYAQHLHEYYNCDMQINPVMPNPLTLGSTAVGNDPNSLASGNKIICG